MNWIILGGLALIVLLGIIIPLWAWREYVKWMKGEEDEQGH